jgi:DNA-binding transcriptional MerR regulator
LSIGDLAASTGLSSDTLRVWERRYGRPTPQRLPSGHRRYTKDHVPWLRRVAEAMRLGCLAREAVCASAEQLDAILRERSQRVEPDEELLACLDCVRNYRTAKLHQLLMGEWERLGTQAFLSERLAPLMVEIGSRWAAGEMEVRHEHFASETCTDLLRELRARHDGGFDPQAPLVLLATLSDEQHTLALHMGALAVRLTGCRVHLLGGDLPVEEIARAADELSADAVAISVSLANGGVATDRRIASLRSLLNREVRVLVGGSGARSPRRGPRGIDYFCGFDSLADWASSLRKG